MSGVPDWHIRGDWFDNCSCAIACPCTFAQPPDNGVCDFVLFWNIVEGRYGDTPLDGLSIVRVGRFTGNLWGNEARGQSGVFVDERADEAQTEAMMTIFGGKAGGFPAVFSGLLIEREQVGVERAKISFEVAPDQSSWGVDIVGRVKAWAEALTGPTSTPGEYPRMSGAPGSETGPGPQLVTWGKSTVCEVDAFGFRHSWTVSSAKHIPFDWSGPDR